MGRNGEESVEKKCTSNLDTGLIRGIILMIIPLSSPLDFVLVARNQIRITGAFFLTDSSTVSNHRKRSSLCLCAGKLLSTCSGLYVIHQTLTPEPVTASLSVQLRYAAFPLLPADVSGDLPVGSA